MRSRSSKGGLRCMRPRHRVAARDERLSLGIKPVVPIVTSWYRVLRFRVVRVDIGWQLPICVRYTHIWLLSHRPSSHRGRRLTHGCCSHLRWRTSARPSLCVWSRCVRLLPIVGRLSRSRATVRGHGTSARLEVTGSGLRMSVGLNEGQLRMVKGNGVGSNLPVASYTGDTDSVPSNEDPERRPDPVDRRFGLAGPGNLGLAVAPQVQPAVAYTAEVPRSAAEVPSTACTDCGNRSCRNHLGVACLSCPSFQHSNDSVT